MSKTSMSSAVSQPTSHPTSNPACFIGIDVAKAELVIARSDKANAKVNGKNNAVQAIVNRERDIKRWLKTIPEGSVIVLESTGGFHQLVCDLAFHQGFTVYLINPSLLRSFRKAQGKRAKTDRCDAQLLALYGQQNHLNNQLKHPYQPASPEEQRLTQLLRRRSVVVGQLVTLRQSLVLLRAEASENGAANRLSPLDVPIEEMTDAAIQALQNLVASFDKRIQSLIQNHPNWNEQAKRLRQVPGMGALSVASLLAAFQRGEFISAEAFVAYLGLDPVACDSGTKQGRRRISKKGDPTTRKILYMAATAAMRNQVWNELGARYKQRGLHHTQVACIIARRMAILAWCMLKRDTTFNPEKLFRSSPCKQT